MLITLGGTQTLRLTLRLDKTITKTISRNRFKRKTDSGIQTSLNSDESVIQNYHIIDY